MEQKKFEKHRSSTMHMRPESYINIRNQCAFISGFIAILPLDSKFFLVIDRNVFEMTKKLGLINSTALTQGSPTRCLQAPGHLHGTCWSPTGLF